MAPQNWTDAELADRCALRDPDQDAWRELYRRFHRLIQWQVSTVLSGESSATVDDVAAEIVEKLYLSIGKYHPARGRLASFITTMARNHARDYQRHVHNERTSTASLDDDSWASLSGSEATLGGLDLETAATRHILRSIAGDQDKSTVFRDLVAGRNPHQIAIAHSMSHRLVYRIKDELVALVREFLDSFLAQTKN